MNDEQVPNDVAGLYDQWVASLQRDTTHNRRVAVLGWAAALALLVALVVVFAALRREQMLELELEEDKDQGDELAGDDKEAQP